MAHLVAKRAINKRSSGNGNLRKAVNKYTSFEKSRLGMTSTGKTNVKGGFNADDVQSYKDVISTERDISELCEVDLAENEIASKAEKRAREVETKETAIEEAEITGSWADEVNGENPQNALAFHPGTSGAEEARVSPKQKQCSDFLNLKYIEPCVEDQKLVIKPPPEVFEIGASQWETSLAGFLHDKKLPHSEIDSVVRKLWGNMGLLDILPYFNDFYIFKFKTKEESEFVLKEGPWHIAGRPLFLQSWHPGMSFDKHEIIGIPIWINLYKLPLELWSELGLSYVASVVGKPIKTDSLTASRKRISYARICVEIYPDSILPDKFKLGLKGGSPMEIFVEYGWIPRTCKNCNVYGHHYSSCKKSPSSVTAKQQWVLKTQKNSHCEEEGNGAKNIGEELVTVQNKRKKTGLNVEWKDNNDLGQNSAQSAMREGGHE